MYYILLILVRVSWQKIDNLAMLETLFIWAVNLVVSDTFFVLYYLHVVSSVT